VEVFLALERVKSGGIEGLRIGEKIRVVGRGQVGHTNIDPLGNFNLLMTVRLKGKGLYTFTKRTNGVANAIM